LKISNQCLQALTPPSGSTSWDKLAKEAGCVGNGTLLCLRNTPATKLKAIIETKALSFNPTTDNFTLVSKPYLKRHESKIANIPILIGSNAQEGRVFQYGKTDLDAYLKETFPANMTEKVRAAYALHTQGLHSNYDIISAIMTDLQFTCPAFLQAHGAFVAGYPSWRYYFNATFPNLQVFPNAGVFHASEIDLIFGTHGKLPTAIGSMQSTSQEIALSDFMQSAWAKFAKNPAGGPGWNKVGSAHSGRPLNGSEPADLGILGGGSSLGVQIVNRKAVDAKCGMFVPLYS
jgi:carboxylesterase type B